MINKLSFLVFLFPFFCFSQTLSGRVIDKVTNLPLESVAIYFDNTTIGTTTNDKGDFSISYTDAIQSTLVISYLGYDKVFIDDYRDKKSINVELVPVSVALDEVYIDNDAVLTRRQKLNLFKREFLGTSQFGKSCKILNEGDLILKYNKQNMTLYASAIAPIIVQNKALQYEVAYDIIDFEVSFSYIDSKTDEFIPNTVTYQGTCFYKNLKKSNRRKTINNREEAYRGSVQHFMRSLYNKSLREEGYWIFHKSFRVNEWLYFKVEEMKDSDFKRVKLNSKVSILYNKEEQSEILLDVEKFYIDGYGNYTPIKGVYFSGIMGSQRVGDTLPSDYGLN